MDAFSPPRNVAGWEFTFCAALVLQSVLCSHKDTSDPAGAPMNGAPYCSVVSCVTSSIRLVHSTVAHDTEPCSHHHVSDHMQAGSCWRLQPGCQAWRSICCWTGTSLTHWLHVLILPLVLWRTDARWSPLAVLWFGGSGFTFSAEPVFGYGQRLRQPLLQWLGEWCSWMEVCAAIGQGGM